MIGYVTVGTDDLDRAKAYFDALFALIGARRVMELPNGFTLYGASPNRPGVAIKPPYNGGPAHPGNGTMTALVVDSRAKVGDVHAKAIELGGSDEGAPGLRGPEGDQAFYGAYFRDLDGNKFCVFHMGPG